METTALIKKPNFWLRVLQFEGTPMLPNLLLMCKLLVLLLLAHHFFAKIQDPFIPFVPLLDAFHTIPNVFKSTMRLLLILSILTLFFNFYVRTSALVIGSIVILQILASKPAFYNHTFICGCALFLAGLSDNKQPPYLIFLQIALIYFGASINKMFDSHWWSGDFMHTWLGVARENPFYLFVNEWFSNLWFAKLLSYIAISTEFLIAVLLLFKKYRNFAIWFIVIFHTMLFTITSFRFGHFIESLAIILLAFLAWPKQTMVVNYKTNRLKLFRKVMNFLDFDNKIVWAENNLDDTTFLKLSIDEKIVINDAALKGILLYTPTFYIILVLIDMALYVVLTNHRTLLFIINLITIWSLIVYFLPIPWSKIFKKNYL